MLTWALASILAAGPAAARYDGHKVVRVYPVDAAAVEVAIDLADDVWTERPHPGRVDVQMSPEGLAALDASGIAYDIVVPDVQIAVDEEYARLADAPAPTHGTWFAEFRDFAEIDGHIDALASMAESVTEVYTVGESLEGRDVRGLKIGRAAQGKAALLLTGTMHAREWLSPMTVMCIADRLITGYGNDPAMTELLDTIDVYVIPVMNPDGYVLSWQGERYWRKNTRGGYGVDLNRNWGYEWGGQGASTNPSDENFRGDAAFSEPETQIIRDFIAARPEFVAHIDFHSFAELVIYPWGYGYDSPPDEAQLADLAGSMADALFDANGRNFQPIQGADFYPAAGAVDDWAYGDQGLMAFTIELRGDDFVVAPSQILPSCEESLAATLDLAAWTAEQSDVMVPPGGTDGAGTDGPGGPGTGGTDGGDDDDTPGGEDGDGPGADDDDNAADDDDNDGGWSGTGNQALPAAYGMTDGKGCSCRTTPAGGVPVAWLLLVLATRRRRATRESSRGRRERA